MSGVSSSHSPETGAAKPVPWSPWLAVFFVLALYFVSQAVAAVLVGIWPNLHHWTSAETTSWLNSSLYAQFFYMLFSSIIVLAAVYQFLRLYGKNLRTISFRRPRLSDPGVGIATSLLYYPVYFVAIALAGALIPGLNTNQAQQLGLHPVGTMQLVFTFIALVVIPPIMEETLFRGFLYTSLKKGMRGLYAALLTSAIFASAHLQFGSGAPLLWSAAIDTFILSMFLVWLREKTGSLWASMTLHALKNLVAFLSLFIFHLT